MKATTDVVVIVRITSVSVPHVLGHVVCLLACSLLLILPHVVWNSLLSRDGSVVWGSCQ